MNTPRRWFSLLTVIFVAIMVAALALGYYSYDAARRMVVRSEESLQSSNRVVGRKLLDRVEKVIIDKDRTFFRLVRLDDPREFMELWRRIVRISPEVQSVIILDQDLNIIHLISRLNHRRLRWFRKIFRQQIVPDMDLDTLRLDAHMHIHKVYKKRSFLLSYIRRQTSGEDYYIILNMNLPYITNEVFKREFQKIEKNRFVAVLNDNGHTIYGHPVLPDGGFVFIERFPTTLYRWRLLVAPREVKTLRQEAKARRRYNLVLVIVAVGVIFVGMLVLLAAIRAETRANKLKSEFISNVSHELKTPLSLIRMFSELLAWGRTKDTKTAKEYAGIITRESDRLTRLIDNVLDFSRIERGKAAYQFKPGSLITVVERTVDLCRHQANKEGIELVVDHDDTLPETLIDEDAMTLLLLNLVENALKYGARQGSAIRVTLEHEEKAIVLKVIDQGEGLPREELSRIFDRFYRTKSARSKSTGGTGIGLSLVKQIAQEHGGKVGVESDLGKGTTFTVTIPIRKTQ